MNEDLLHYIWRYQRYNTVDLRTTAGNLLQITAPGQYNTNQGPDFDNAKVYIDEVLWAGAIEIHIKTSDWDAHAHSNDKHYTKTILHVVWEHDKPCTADIPVLELRERVPKLLLDRFYELMRNNYVIPCSFAIAGIDQLVWENWIQRLLAERMDEKLARIKQFLIADKNHWEETFWWLIARNFGMKVNADAFESLAKTLPLSLLAKHKQQLLQIEAMLMGQAGILNGTFSDDYMQMLQKEYLFLQKKYKLQPNPLPVKFLRMRPASFPTLRLSQLAALIHKSVHLFAKIKEEKELVTVRHFFEVSANDYWQYHYLPDEPTPFSKKNTGQQMADNIIINTVVPMLFAYGNYYKDDAIKEKSLYWLQQIAAEKNTVVKRFTDLGIKAKSAMDTQALLQLEKNYCSAKQCLHCAVGNAILKR
jgi:hypothetical protein